VEAGGDALPNATCYNACNPPPGTLTRTPAGNGSLPGASDARVAALTATQWLPTK